MRRPLTRRDMIAGSLVLAASARAADGGDHGSGAPGRESKPDRAEAGAPPKPVTLVAVGDVTLGYHLEEYLDDRLKNGVSLEAALAYPFDGVRSIFSAADLVVANLECPFTIRGEKLPKNFNFRARPELVGALQAAGVHVVTLANNHMMDYGADGLVDTLTTLDSAKVAHCGAGRTLAEARKPVIVKRAGISFGFLGYFFLGDRNIEPPAVLAAADRPGVAGTYRDYDGMKKMLAEDLADLRRHADIPVVFWHWGREGTSELEDYQVELGHQCVDQGARLVLGSHPHVLQGMEQYKGVPIVYSLGNFVFGGNANPRNKDSAIFRSRLDRSGVVSSDVVPIQTTRVPEAPFQPTPADEEGASRIRSFLAKAPLRGGAVLSAVEEKPAP